MNIPSKRGLFFLRPEGEGVMISTTDGNYNTTNNSFMFGAANEDISFILSGNFYSSDEPYFPDIYQDEYSWYSQEYRTNGELLTSPCDNTIVDLPIEKYDPPTTAYAIHVKLKVKNFEVGYFRNYESRSSSISTLPEYSVYSKEASDFQDIYYLGTNITDQEGNDLTVAQDFYYLQWRSVVTKKLSLSIDGRLDFNTRYESTLNPRAGLVYSPTDKLKIKFLCGRANLAPSPYRQYQHYGSFRSLTDEEGNLLSSDPYSIINLSARYMLVEKEKYETEVFQRISNLLNSKYYNVSIGGAESILMAPQDPIRFLLGIRFNFIECFGNPINQLIDD